MSNRYLLIYFSEYKYINVKKKYIYRFSTLEDAIHHLSKMKSEDDKRVTLIDIKTGKTILDVEY